MGISRQTSTTWFGWCTGEAKQEKDLGYLSARVFVGLWDFLQVYISLCLLCMLWSWDISVIYPEEMGGSVWLPKQHLAFTDVGSV